MTLLKEDVSNETGSQRITTDWLKWMCEEVLRDVCGLRLQGRQPWTQYSYFFY